MTHDPFGVHGTFATSTAPAVGFYNLPALEAAGVGPISRLPVSVRIVLESLLRNCDGERVTEAQVRQLANWQPTATRTEEIPFVVARVVLQDFTGVPLLCDLATMREATARLGRDPKLIEPLVPVDIAGSTPTSPATTRCGTPFPRRSGRSTPGRIQPTSPSRHFSRTSRWSPVRSRKFVGREPC